MRASRRRYPIPQVDMTPFVCVALLLLTFFVWMKQLQRDKIVAVYGQTRAKAGYYLPVTDSLVLLGNDRVGLRQFWANGATSYVETNCSAAALRTMVRRIALFENPIIIIQPTAQSSIGNLVAVVEALRLNGRITYMLTF